jgi:hypothetical protein
MRDAIILSTWSWDRFNVPERIALALAMRGARVLYCEIPASPIQAEGASSLSHREWFVRFWSSLLLGSQVTPPRLGISNGEWCLNKLFARRVLSAE